MLRIFHLIRKEGARYGKEFGGYRLIDVPEPKCGEEDIIVEEE